MKKLLLILALLGVAAGFKFSDVAFLKTATVEEVAGGGAPTYLFEEDCEGSGTPSGWTDVGTVYWDDSTNELAGAESLTFDGISALASSWKAFTGQSEVWFYCNFEIPSGYSSGDRNMIYLLDSSGTEEVLVYRNGGKLSLYNVGDTTIVTTTDSVSADTTHHLWVHIKRNGAGASTWEIEFNTSGTKSGSGTDYAGTTTGPDPGADLARLKLQAQDTDFVVTYDTVRVDDENIGSSPPWSAVCKFAVGGDVLRCADITG